MLPAARADARKATGMKSADYYRHRRRAWNTILMLCACNWLEGKVAAIECADGLNHSNEVRAFHLWGKET